MAVVKEQDVFLSADKVSSIVYTSWHSDTVKPHAVLLIAHGMAEYIDRYDDFARYMVRHGYAVFGNDHLGHGKTAANADDLGYFAEKDGRYFVVDDMKSLCFTARATYPGVPVVLLGHSMGSFIARLFCMRYSNDINAAIFMGSSGSNPAAAAGIALVNVIARFKGEKHRSAFVDKIAFGANNKGIANPKTAFDWLSTDEAVVKRYVDDEKCGYLFTLSAYRELFRMVKDVNRKGWTDTIRKDLPVLVVSGMEDPVGANGKGVQEVFEALHNAGLGNLSIMLYEGMRHEILNENEKETVYTDILRWCEDAAGCPGGDEKL